MYGGKSGWTRGTAVVSMLGRVVGPEVLLYCLWLDLGKAAWLGFALQSVRRELMGMGGGGLARRVRGVWRVFRRACGEVAKSMGRLARRVRGRGRVLKRACGEVAKSMGYGETGQESTE